MLIKSIKDIIMDKNNSAINCQYFSDDSTRGGGQFNSKNLRQNFIRITAIKISKFCKSASAKFYLNTN